MSSSPETVSVAFVEDLSPEGAIDRVFPALRAAELALETPLPGEDDPLTVELVPFDLGDSGATPAEAAAEIAADPAFVAAIAAPDLSGQAELAAGLWEAGVPLLSLSARGAVTPERPGLWLRFVPSLEAQAQALAAAVRVAHGSRRGVCVVAAPADGTTYPRVVRRLLPRDLDVLEVPDASAVAGAGCGVVVWTGNAVGGAELAAALAPIVPRSPTLIGGPGLRDLRFPELAGAAAEGAVSLCACADVTTSLDLGSQRFVQDYQSRFGSPPGPFAAEAWDAARLLARGVLEAGPSRSALVAWLALLPDVDGLAGRLAFVNGEIADPGSAVRRYRVEGGRWVAIAPVGAR
ncbi:MAG: ABC transporter substrate-binding protein [Actinomycetota bacterium]